MDELKPCPFCGKKAKLYVSSERGISVKCTNYDCLCQTPWCEDWSTIRGNDRWIKEETACEYVIKIWNRRAE